MQQVSRGSSQTPEPLQLISARTLFAARPTGPPSSPPPTSPLPPLPKSASHREQRTPISFSVALGRGHPARPPRPTTSLPNLKPRTITSPEIYRRQKNTELTAQVNFSQTQQSSPVESPSKQVPQKTPEYCNPIRLPTPTPQSSSTFSEDVLSALPKLFQRSPRHCLNTAVGSPLGSANGTDRLKAWQVYHRSPTKSSPRSKKRKTDTKKPVARTALFIPRTPPNQPNRTGIHYPRNHCPLLATSQSCYEAQSRNTSFGTVSPQRDPSKTALTGSPAKSSPFSPHKRTQAVTGFAFDFGKCYGSPPSISYGSSTDNLTSLPRLPSSSDVHFPVLGHGSSATGYPCPHVISELEKRASEEAIAFASIPYAHTIHSAGPQPKTEPDPPSAKCVSQGPFCPQAPKRHLRPPRCSSQRMNRRPTDLEIGAEEEEREPTEEEIKKAKKKRLLWIIATISLVLTATRTLQSLPFCPLYHTHSPKSVPCQLIINLINEYLKGRSEAFAKLDEVRRLGWSNPQGDTHFQQQRKRADTANEQEQRLFFNMMRQIGDEMQAATSAIRVQEARPLVLDVCAAPGGFLGGHPLLISHGDRNPQVNVHFLDITKLGLEYGLMPEELEPDMSAEQPYPNLQCDLVFRDGQVLRTNEAHRDPSREKQAAKRLRCSQLILAMNRMKQGGTLIMLLHKAEAWHTLELLATFAESSDLQIFKPVKKHATRSSFYLVARNVRPGCTAARLAVEKWKGSWTHASIGPPSSALTMMEDADGEEQEAVSRVLETFGEQFVRLLDPIWDIQRAAIERAPWFKASTTKSDGLTPT